MNDDTNNKNTSMNVTYKENHNIDDNNINIDMNTHIRKQNKKKTLI